MKSFIKLLLFVGFVFSQHFVVEIEDTGSSTLFVFESSIFSLDAGDELGIFDANGVLDANGNTGEILVGAGVWEGGQLEITAITAVDLSQFGGPILPGANSGNPMLLKVWNDTEEMEYSVTYNVVQGSGTFDGLFTAKLHNQKNYKIIPYYNYQNKWGIGGIKIFFNI